MWRCRSADIRSRWGRETSSLNWRLLLLLLSRRLAFPLRLGFLIAVFRPPLSLLGGIASVLLEQLLRGIVLRSDLELLDCFVALLLEAVEVAIGVVNPVLKVLASYCADCIDAGFVISGLMQTRLYCSSERT